MPNQRLTDAQPGEALVDINSLTIKAILADFDESVATGYFHMRHGIIPHIGVVENNDIYFYEIDRESICRCTGIKTPQGEYLYEFDLCEFRQTYRDEVYMGYIDFNDRTSSWVMRLETESMIYAKMCDCHKLCVVGNVILYDTDFNRLKIHNDKQV